jgi:muramidase (phage lysozyme)
VVETTTEKHEGKPGNAEERIPKPEQGDLGDLSSASPAQIIPTEPAPPANGSETTEPVTTTATPSPQSTKTEAPKKKPNAKPKAPSREAEPKAKQQAAKPPQHISGKEEAKPKLERGRDENGNPLAVVTQKALDWWNSWRMPTFNLWGTPAATGQGGTAPATPVKVDTEMIKKVEALLEFAREQTEYDYKASGEGTAAVLASMGKGTFKHEKKEKGNWISLGLCYTYVKVALSRCKIIDGLLDGVSASKAGPSLIAKGFKDVTAEVPDGRWAAAGDMIVYEWTDSTWEIRKKKDSNTPNHGHIDIRDYEFYISDFIPKFEPRKYLGRPSWSHYQNIRIYRKVFDLLPTQRIRAFLRCIREFECQAEHDDAKRYQMLNYPPPGNSGGRFSGYATHPWDGFTPPGKPHSTAAGAYQILQGTWKEVFDNGLIELKGDRFSPAVQDRIAVMKLEDRAALHLVRTGRIQEAISKLTSEWTSLPGGKENANRLAGDKKPMDMAYFQSLFDKYLNEERKNG